MRHYKKNKIRGSLILLGAFFSLTVGVSSSCGFNRVLTAEATKSNYWSSFISSHTSELTRGGESLLNALNTKISNNVTTISYDGLDTAYKQTDIVPDSSNRIWDMYGYDSFTFSTDECGNYSQVGNCYNKEHSIPKSWFGGKVAPMYSDIVHVVPTDGYINNWRSNYPFGEVQTPDKNKIYRFGDSLIGGNVYQVAGESKLGSPKSINGISVSSDKVFEPDDQYKGDFARIYMYFATRYGGIATSGNGSTTFKSTYPYFTSYGLELIRKWHVQDPVSQKEIDRNDGIEATQGNRNPFVDYPEWANKIFGTNYVSEALEKLIMNTTSENLAYGSTLQLSVTPTPSSASSLVSWSSSNEKVAKVDTNGLVTIQNETGYALISATSLEDASIKAYCNITTYAPTDVDLEEINLTDLELNVGEKKAIDVSYAPKNAYPVPELKYEYDENYITLDGENNVVALKEGSTTLKVYAYQNKAFVRSASSLITINKDTSPDIGESVSITFSTSTSDDGTLLDQDSIKNVVSSGSEYIASYSSLTKLYKGKEGLKLGSSNGAGSLTMSFVDDVKNNLLKAVSIDSSQYGDDIGKLQLYLNGNSNADKSFTPGDSDNTYNLSSSISLESLTIKTSSKRAYLSNITLYFESGASQYKASDFANEFYNAINCDVTGVNSPSFKEGYSWSSFKDLYESISSNSEKNKLINATYSISGSGSGTTITPIGETTYLIAKAMYRYDYIINKYNQSSIVYESFIQGRSANFDTNHPFSLRMVDNNTYYILIAVISFSLFTGSLIGVGLIINKKKIKE